MAASTVIDVPTEQVASSTVSAQGGVLSYGPMKLDLPAGAVTSDTKIVVRELSQPFHEEAATTNDPRAAAATPLGAAFDFGPAGVQFDKPVTITLPYDPGMGPNGVDPSHVAIAYWNGKQWIVAGGTADPSTNTVSVQLKAFDGIGLLPIAIATTVGYIVNRVITWHYGGEGTNSDPVTEGKAANYVTPTDPIVKTQASKAVLKNTTTKKVKSLTDPDLATWVAEAASKGEVPTLGFQQPDGTVKTSSYDDQTGSNWQTPADYFNKGTVNYGPISGDCTDVTNAAVSIFRADGFQAAGVYGYEDKDKDKPHAWGEVVIGGNVYRIDEWGGIITPTSNPYNFTHYQPPEDPKDAHYKSMWSDPDQGGQQVYNPNWWKAGASTGINGTWTGMAKENGPHLTGSDYVELVIEIGADGKGVATGGTPNLAVFKMPATYVGGVLSIQYGDLANVFLTGQLNGPNSLTLTAVLDKEGDTTIWDLKRAN